MDCIKNDASKNSSLPRERVYRAIVLQLHGDTQTDPQTLLWNDKSHRDNDASNSSSFVACIYSRGHVFKQPLPSNDRRDHTYRHTNCWEEFMKYAVKMGSDTMIYIPSFIKIGLCIKKLIGGTHRQQGHLIRLLLLFQNKGKYVKNLSSFQDCFN
jgi:hypothetical protein